MYIIYAMINLLGSSAITIGNNIMYKFTRPVERTAAIAINTILTGLVAFFTTLLITPLFNYIKDVKGSFIFGRTIYAQQLLAALSVTIGLILIIFLYTKFTKVINATPDEEED